MIKYENERVRLNTHLGCSAPRIITKEKGKYTKREKRSVYGVRHVTYLVNDGFLKPALIYRLRVFAL